MNIWIDMDNSPHVPLLLPLIKELETRGYKVIITARDYAQTLELLIIEGVPFVKIGKHTAKNKILKILEISKRTIRLIKYARNKQITFSINHGSRAQAAACKILGIPCYIGMDYEHTESRIFAACATKIWIPELLFPTALPSIGVKEDKIIVYKGLKEQFYLKDFKPDVKFKTKLNIPANKVLVVLRPPAEIANYHDIKSVKLLNNIIDLLLETREVFTICTPRTSIQKQNLKKYESASFRVLDEAIDGKNLVYHTDIMISGGGTMNREAAYFGAHVYSIFSGKKPILDLELQRLGFLSFINSAKDLNIIQFKSKMPEKTNFFKTDENRLKNLLDSIIQNEATKINILNLK